MEEDFRIIAELSLYPQKILHFLKPNIGHILAIYFEDAMEIPISSYPHKNNLAMFCNAAPANAQRQDLELT